MAIHAIQEVEEQVGLTERLAESAEQLIRVLIVEDNPGDARLIEFMLGEAGRGELEVESVDRLEKAFERLGQQRVDLVLLDLSLPDSHGLETFARLHLRAPQTPIIVLSGLNDTRVAIQAVHEGAQDYLVKGQVEGQLLVRSIHYAIERKRMAAQLARYAEELRAKNAQLESDFKMAREIQEMFLPHQYPSFPRWVSPEQSAMRFSHRYLPAAAVGGDFFDIIPITDTTAGIFICDVMGHGMRAALITAIMRGLLEELMPVAADAGKFLTEINRSLRAILHRTQEPFLATAAYLVLDVAGPELRFANAGHPSPLLVQRTHGTTMRLKDCDSRHGPALGLFEKASYPTGRCPLAANDLVLLFTDGIYEEINAQHEEFGQERLLNAVQEQAQLPTEKLLERLLYDAQQFAGTQQFQDDVCLVAAEVRRAGSRWADAQPSKS